MTRRGKVAHEGKREPSTGKFPKYHKSTKWTMFSLRQDGYCSMNGLIKMSASSIFHEGPMKGDDSEIARYLRYLLNHSRQCRLESCQTCLRLHPLLESVRERLFATRIYRATSGAEGEGLADSARQF
jgi:hypothetical protein